MDFNLKKSKMFLLSIIPFFFIIGAILNIFDPTNTSYLTIYNSHSTVQIIALVINVIIPILLYSLFLYLGILFSKKKSNRFYKVFSILNFIYFGFYVFSSIANIFIHNSPPPTNHTAYLIASAIFFIPVLLFNVVDIFLIFNYNHHSKKLSFA